MWNYTPPPETPEQFRRISEYRHNYNSKLMSIGEGFGNDLSLLVGDMYKKAKKISYSGWLGSILLSLGVGYIVKESADSNSFDLNLLGNLILYWGGLFSVFGGWICSEKIADLYVRNKIKDLKKNFQDKSKLIDEYFTYSSGRLYVEPRYFYDL